MNDPQRPLDEALQLTSFTCRTPIAALGLRTPDGWRHRVHGIDLERTPVDLAPMAQALSDISEPLVVDDTTADPRFEGLSAVTGAPGVRAYAGVPLVSSETARHLGVLCIIDTQPRAWRADVIDALELLGRLMATQLEVRQTQPLDRDLAEGRPGPGRRHVDDDGADDLHGRYAAYSKAKAEEEADQAEERLRQDTASHDWDGLRDRLSDVLVRIERLQRRNDDEQTDRH